MSAKSGLLATQADITTVSRRRPTHPLTERRLIVFERPLSNLADLEETLAKARHAAKRANLCRTCPACLAPDLPLGSIACMASDLLAGSRFVAPAWRGAWLGIDVPVAALDQPAYPSPTGDLVSPGGFNHYVA
jgi:hypothetical protein